MTLDQIANMVLEGIRSNHIVDDEDIDLRLVKDWIHLKRAQYVKNVTKNPAVRISLANYQIYTVTVAVRDITKINSYPFDNTLDPGRQLMKIVVSTIPIPGIVESNAGPMVYSVETTDQMKYAFTFVDYEYLKVAGNGRFNQNLVFASVRDNYLYFKYNSIFNGILDIDGSHGIPVIKLRAVFDNPTLVPGFSDSTTDYPCSLEVIEYIKNGIFDKDAKMLLTTKSDKENDSSGEI